MSIVVAFANQKGGVGKTTTVVNIARAAITNHRLTVLVIDADPQGNATKVLAPNHQGSLPHSLATVIGRTAHSPISTAAVASDWTGLDVVPSGGDDLANAAQDLVTMTAGRESRLKKAITEISDRYDLILIDCPPSLDQLPINAFTAADALVLVAELGQFALDGLDRLLDTVEVIQEYTNPELTIVAAIINDVQKTKRMDYWMRELRDSIAHLPEPVPVLDPPVQRATFIAEAQESGQGLDMWGTVKARVLHQTYADYLTSILQSIKNGENRNDSEV
ncbi:Chromosome partitioning protein ParA [Rhodococcus erythropolis]|uniref:ParA family protein n=1 Tax=Rhodococcus erythropolis TaxID=1833 RepID=UPI00155464E4|nr:AAA family ATPase [Rhodococcus erythropolis]PBI95383.1 Chromosome partitioning protein ParA [Rhodococcus erythropolis]